MFLVCYALAPKGGIKRWCCLTSVAYIGPKSRTERPRKVAHVTHDSDTAFKVENLGHQATLLTAVSASASCSGCRVDRGKVLTVGTEDADSHLLRCTLQGRGHSVAAPQLISLHSQSFVLICFSINSFSKLLSLILFCKFLVKLNTTQTLYL